MSKSDSHDDRHVLVREMEMERDRGQEMAEVRQRVRDRNCVGDRKIERKRVREEEI